MGHQAWWQVPFPAELPHRPDIDTKVYKLQTYYLTKLEAWKSGIKTLAKRLSFPLRQPLSVPRYWSQLSLWPGHRCPLSTPASLLLPFSHPAQQAMGTWPELGQQNRMAEQAGRTGTFCWSRSGTKTQTAPSWGHS